MDFFEDDIWSAYGFIIKACLALSSLSGGIDALSLIQCGKQSLRSCKQVVMQDPVYAGG